MAQTPPNQLDIGFGQDSDFQIDSTKERIGGVISNPFGTVSNLVRKSNENLVALNPEVRAKIWRIDPTGEAPATSWIKRIFGTEDTGVQWKICKGRNSALHSMYKDPERCETEEERNKWINFHSSFLTPIDTPTEVGVVAKVSFDDPSSLSNPTFEKNVNFINISPLSLKGLQAWVANQNNPGSGLGVTGGKTVLGIPIPGVIAALLPSDPDKTYNVTSGWHRALRRDKPNGQPTGGLHAATDIGTNTGDRLYSPYGNGKVIQSIGHGGSSMKRRWECGWGVSIKYPDQGLTMILCHMSAIKVKKGAIVQRGDFLGLVGGDKPHPGRGNSKSSHTHVALIQKGRGKVDPQLVPGFLDALHKAKVKKCSLPGLPTCKY